MSIRIADGYVDVGLEDNTDRDLDKILAKLRAAGEKRGIPIGVDDQTARPLRDLDTKLKTWTASHSQTVKINGDSAGYERAALAARRAALSSEVAADKATAARKREQEAAEQLAKGEITEAEAAKVAADAKRQVERASIAAAEAARANASAEDKLAAQYRQAGRDAELSAAAQRLSSLKASGSVKEHNALIVQLESRYGNLGKEGAGAFQQIEKTGTSAFASIGSSGPGSIALIVAALAAVPFAATAAEAAISLGVGGALAGVGLMATKSDSDVQQALQKMTSHIKSETRQMATPFISTWLQIARTGQDTFDKLAPTLERDFKQLAPAVSGFVRDAGEAATRLAPAFDASTRAADKLLGALGDKLPQIAGNVDHAIEIMANSAGQNSDEFANLVTNVSALLPPLARATDLAVKFGGAVNPVFDIMAHGRDILGSGGGLFSQLSKSLEGTTGSADSAGSSMTSTGAATEKLLTAQKAATMTSDQLKSALDRLTGANQSSFDASVQYREALNGANAQAKANNSGIDGNSKAALANSQALSTLATSIKGVIANGDQSAGSIKKMRDNFISAAEGMGVSKSRAKELANELLGVSADMKKIPDKKDTKLGATDNTGAGVASAKKNTSSFTDKIHSAALTAKNLAAGGVSAATGLAKRFAGGLYRGSLTAANKAGSAVSSATSLANRFAHGTYRAMLSAVNGATSAFNSAMSLGRSWASKVFSATFNVIKKINPFATGGYIGGYADGGPIQSYPDGGPVSGPGTETSDSIPIMTSQGMINGSDGEYMVNARQTKKYRGLLDLINYGVGGFAHGGPVGPGYASGGKVTAARKASGTSLVNSIEAHLLSSLDSIKDVASKVNDSIKKYFSGSTETKMLAWAKAIEGQWESAAGKLATLKDKIKEATDYAASAKSTVLGGADVGNLGTLGNASDISSGLGFKLQQMQAFSSKISQLQKLGLTKSFLTQIINAGPDQGGAIADMLLKDTGQIAVINTQEGQLDKIAGEIGNTAADVMYDTGTDAAKGFLSGLYGQQKALEKLMTSLGKKLADGIASKYKLPKPKKHAAGGIAAAGELALVGEEGPELISVGTTSRVYPAGQTAGMLGGSGVHIEGGVHVHVTGTFDFSDPKAAERLAEQAADAIREKIRKLDKAHR